MNTRTIAAAWRAFDRLALPATASAEQRRDTRRAFYAGAQTFFQLTMETLDPGQEPTDADMDRMSGWADELAEFGAAMRLGEA